MHASQYSSKSNGRDAPSHLELRWLSPIAMSMSQREHFLMSPRRRIASSFSPSSSELGRPSRRVQRPASCVTNGRAREAAIALPEEANVDEIAEQVEVARSKVDHSVADSLRIEWFEEGTVAQIMHVGPYGEERPNDRAAPRGDRGRGHAPTRTSP